MKKLIFWENPNPAIFFRNKPLKKIIFSPSKLFRSQGIFIIFYRLLKKIINIFPLTYGIFLCFSFSTDGQQRANNFFFFSSLFFILTQKTAMTSFSRCGFFSLWNSQKANLLYITFFFYLLYTNLCIIHKKRHKAQSTHRGVS